MIGKPTLVAGEQTSPTRSLELYLAELVQQLRLLPMTSAARPALVARIRAVEAEIDARSPT